MSAYISILNVPTNEAFTYDNLPQGHAQFLADLVAGSAARDWLVHAASAGIQVPRSHRSAWFEGDPAPEPAPYTLADEPETDGCEGHVDTDDALLSGVGIGEPVYCDGSCNPSRPTKPEGMSAGEFVNLVTGGPNWNK